MARKTRKKSYIMSAPKGPTSVPRKRLRQAVRQVIRERTLNIVVEEKPAFPFQFLGFRDGWYALRADMTPSKQPWGLALEFSNEIFEWLYDQHITHGKWAWFGNGNVHTDRPKLPVPEDGSHFGLLLKRPADVIRFERRFPCLGITPEAMLDALRAEASEARLTAEDITRIAYEANMRLGILTGSVMPAWDDVPAEERLLFAEGVKLHIARPKRTDKEIHDDWLKTMYQAGWTHGSAKDSLLKTHPSIVPFEELSLLEKIKDRLHANIVESLLPLLND